MTSDASTIRSQRGSDFWRRLRRLMLRERAEEVIAESKRKKAEMDAAVDRLMTTLDGESKWFVERSLKSNIQCECQADD